MYRIRWKNACPYCWQVSTDGGVTWEDLTADNEEDSSEAVDEAAELFGIPTNRWDLEE